MQPADGEGKSLKELFSLKLFWAFMIMMLCAGASEQAVSQWASTFAEEGLGVSKTIGDLAGPMAFAFLMGTARLIYGKCGDRINLNGFMVLSAGLCIISYLCISLIPVPLIGLLGCAICGFSVGIMWPGTISKAAFAIRGGGYGNVCDVCSSRRHWLYSWPITCWFCGRSFGKDWNRYSFSDYLPGNNVCTITCSDEEEEGITHRFFVSQRVQ